MNKSLTVRARFYSKAVLGTLHHDAAVQVWSKISKGQDVPLEKALAAFDMFISEDNEGDFDAVCSDADVAVASVLISIGLSSS